MSWDLHPQEMLDKASSLPVTQTPEVGIFHNLLEGSAKVAMQGLAKTARAVDLLGSVGPIIEDWTTDQRKARALGQVPANMPKTVTAQERYFREHDDLFQSAVDYWTPRPNEVGVAGEVAGSLLSMLPTIMASPALAVGATQLAQGEDLVREGVGAGKAQAVGAVQALGLGAGIWMPILGTNAVQRILIGGAGFNVAQGVATRAASKAILEGEKAAEQFRPLGGTELTLDILLGLAFGGYAHINPEARAQGAKAWEEIGDFMKGTTPSDKAALAALREAQHINADTLPGTPMTAADLDVHVQRMRAAIDSLASDKPVNVEAIVKDTETAPAPPDQTITPETGNPLETIGASPSPTPDTQPRYNPDMARIEQDNAIREAIQEHARTVAAEEGIPQIPDRKTIAQTIEEQLVQAGRPPEEAKAGATLWQAFFDQTAKTYGRTGQELFDRYMKGITGQAGEDPKLEQRRTAREILKADEARVMEKHGAYKTKDFPRGEMHVDIAEKLAKAGDPDAGPAAMLAYLESDFTKLTEDTKLKNPATKALVEYVRSLPKDDTGPLYRVLAWETEAERSAFMKKIQKGADTALQQERPIMSFTTDNPEGKTPMNHIGLDLAAQFGEHAVVLKVLPPAGKKTMRIGADISSSYGATAKGLDVVVPRDQQYKVIGAHDDGNTKVVTLEALETPVDAAKLFQGAVPWYHSELERQISTAKMGSASPKDWKNYIKGLSNKGVKADEVKWTGLEEWLDLQEGKVTKEQIQEYMKDGGVKVEETMLGGTGEKSLGDRKISADVQTLKDAGWRIEHDPENTDYIAFMDDAGDIHDAADIARFAQQDEPQLAPIAEAAKRISAYWTARPPASTKFSQYVLPGGENYRELLLTLPTKEPVVDNLPPGWSVEQMANGRSWTLIGPSGVGTILNTLPSGSSREMALVHARDRLARDNKLPEKPSTFQSNHFDQPNILSHIRFNERTDADGKRVLFIEEIQSDWAQMGRKAGFKTPDPKPPSIDELKQKYGWTIEKAQEGAPGPWEVTFRDKSKAYYDTQAIAESELVREWKKDNGMNMLGTNDGKPPLAPFVGKTEAWVGLSLKRMIRYAAENGFDRVAWANGEQSASRYDLSKQIGNVQLIATGTDGALGKNSIINASRPDGSHALSRTVNSESEIADLIGKEAAKRLLEKDPQTGLGRNKGSTIRVLEGLDLKVGGEGMKAFYDKIVPNVANDVLKRLGGGRTKEVEIDTRKPEDEAWYQELTDANIMRQPGFDITPELRAKALETQALFQPAYHASPHTFDEFKLQHIGSGEGAQVYGWGLYFATNTKVRDWYYDNFMAKAKNEASIKIATGLFDPANFDSKGYFNEEFKKKLTEPQRTAIYEYMRSVDDGNASPMQYLKDRLVDIYGKEDAAKTLKWFEENAANQYHIITPNDDPAYKTPTGEVVHTRLGGEAKAKADAIGQLMHQGYAGAAKTFDNLIIMAKQAADDATRNRQSLIDDWETELNKGKWEARPVSGKSLTMAYDVMVNGSTYTTKVAIAPEVAIKLARDDMAQQIGKIKADNAKDAERVTVLEKARALLDEYTELRPQISVQKNDQSTYPWRAIDNKDGTLAGMFHTEAEAQKRADTLNEGTHGLRQIKPGIEKVEPQLKKPRKYEVELAPDEAEYLPWETNLADMPIDIRAKLEGIIDPHYFEQPDLYNGKDLYTGLVRTAKEIKKGNEDDFQWTDNGIDDYANMSPEEMASKLLNAVGIPGIKYFDGFSRKRGEGSYNIVLFDDSKVTIKHMEQDANRGYLNMGPDGKMAIGILQSADASTFLHESGHFFLEVTNDLASQPDAPAGMKQDMQTLYNWFNVKDADTWNNMTLDEKRPYHEQFARGFERYLRDGQAPTSALKGLFQRFRDWLVQVYKSATQLNVTVTDEVRAVMDRMLAEPQRTEAPPEAARSSAPPPPRGGVGEPMGEASVPEPTPPKVYETKTADDPQIMEMLRDMATNETGWAQVGGKWMGKAEKGSGVPNFTTWIPKAEWWTDRPDKKMNEAKYIEAVTKHMTDEKMTPAEKRAVQYMTDIANKRLEAQMHYEEGEWNRIAQEVANEGLEPTTRNVVDADAVSIAMQIDEARVERAAITAADEHDFMAQVRDVINGHEQAAAGQDAGATERGTPAGTSTGAGPNGNANGAPGQAAEAAGTDRNAGNQRLDPVAQQALRMVAENPTLQIATGTDAEGNPTYQTAADYLADAKAKADATRQDVGLFELAAQCLLGGGR